MSDQPIETVEMPGEIFDAEVGKILDGEPAPYHPVLESWRAVLEPIASESSKKITPQWASRITASYREIDFADMPRFHALFYARLQELADLVDDEIATDDECLNVTDAAEDLEHNSQHYRNLLLNWQKAVLTWELDWDTASEDAAVDLAAISEVHKMFFGPTGFTSYLENIQFVFTEDDQAAMGAELEALKESRE